MKKKEYDALARASEQLLHREVPPPEEIPEHEFSPEFQEKMQNLFQKEKKRSKDGLKQAAAVALVFLGIALGGVSTAQALHLPVIQTIISMVQDFTEYRFSAGASAPEAPLGGFTMTHLPEGMEEVSRQEGEDLYVLEWRSPEGDFLILEQQLVAQDTVSVYGADEQGAHVTRFFLQGVEAVGREKGGNSSIFWTKDSFFYLLNSSLPLEELRRVAEEMSF